MVFCNFKKFYKEPEEKYVCMSTVIFLPESYIKLTYGNERNVRDKKQNMFIRNLMITAKRLITGYYPKNYYLRIYFDESLTEVMDKWGRFFKMAMKHPKIQLIKYNCPDYVVEKKYHVELFGTMVRFHALFESQSQIEMVCIVDADNIASKDWLRAVIDFQNSDYDIHTFQGFLEAPFYKADIYQRYFAYPDC